MGTFIGLIAFLELIYWFGIRERKQATMSVKLLHSVSVLAIAMSSGRNTDDNCHAGPLRQKLLRFMRSSVGHIQLSLVTVVAVAGGCDCGRCDVDRPDEARPVPDNLLFKPRTLLNGHLACGESRGCY